MGGGILKKVKIGFLAWVISSVILKSSFILFISSFFFFCLTGDHVEKEGDH